MGNRAWPQYAAPLARALAHEAEPLVRGHAAWALGRVAAAATDESLRPSAAAALAEAARRDADAWVREEAGLALGVEAAG
jgi:hypothetical protein